MKREIFSHDRPILRRLFFTQLLIFLFGVGTIALTIGVTAFLIDRTEVQNAKVSISSKIEPLQERWRAWSLTGLSDALSGELSEVKNSMGLEILELVDSKRRGEFSGNTFLVFPKSTSEDMPGSPIVVAKFSTSSTPVFRQSKEIIFIIVFSLVLFLVLIFYSHFYIRRKIHAPIELLNLAFERVETGEELNLTGIRGDGEIKIFISGIEKMYRAVKENEEQLAFSQIAKQVSHDIISPVRALKVAFEAGESGVELGLKAISRIENISLDLLEKSRSGVGKPDFGKVKLMDIITDIAAEKNFSKRKFEISSNLSPLVAGDKKEIERIVSNLLQNSVEATEDREDSIIRASVTKLSHSISLSIEDNGCGIPSSVISRIGEEGFSYNKSNGNGLGVSHAKSCLRSWGGDLKLKSQVGIGTVASLYFIEV